MRTAAIGIAAGVAGLLVGIGVGAEMSSADDAGSSAAIPRDGGRDEPDGEQAGDRAPSLPEGFPQSVAGVRFGASLAEVREACVSQGYEWRPDGLAQGHCIGSRQFMGFTVGEVKVWASAESDMVGIIFVYPDCDTKRCFAEIVEKMSREYGEATRMKQEAGASALWNIGEGVISVHAYRVPAGLQVVVQYNPTGGGGPQLGVKPPIQCDPDRGCEMELDLAIPDEPLPARRPLELRCELPYATHAFLFPFPRETLSIGRNADTRSLVLEDDGPWDIVHENAEAVVMALKGSPPLREVLLLDKTNGRLLDVTMSNPRLSAYVGTCAPANP